MVDKLKTDPPHLKKGVDEKATKQLDQQELSFNYHEQFLRQLYRQYNIEVNHAILFYVEDHEEPVIFVGKDKIIVGREDAMGRITPEFETTRFNGSANGISRMHAKIVREGDQYLIQDLGSTNGTRLNGNKLVPYQYVPLHDGAILQFGRLMVSAFIINRDED